MKSKIIQGMTADKYVRFYLEDATAMVEKARDIHDTTPVATAALGRTLIATSIMGRMLKGEKEKLTLQIKGSRRIKTILAVSDATGNVKGVISHPHVEMALNEEGKLDVGGSIGQNGQLVVVRDLGLKEPYVGQSDLITGEIAEDLAIYFAQSEQQPSVVSLGVYVDEDLSVGAAGGLIIQPLPDTPDDVITTLENSILSLPPISSLLHEGLSYDEILTRALGNMNYEIMDETEVDYICDCNLEKFEKGLISLGKSELKDIIEEDGQAELTCHFCNKKYHFDKKHLQKLMAEATAK